MQRPWSRARETLDNALRIRQKQNEADPRLTVAVSNAEWLVLQKQEYARQITDGEPDALDDALLQLIGWRSAHLATVPATSRRKAAPVAPRPRGAVSVYEAAISEVFARIAEREDPERSEALREFRRTVL